MGIIINPFANMLSPTSLANIKFWYDMGNHDTVFSDAGVTKLTSTGSCYQINDLSDNQLHLSNSASGQRPTWNSDGYLDFDGAGDHLSTNDGDNSGDAQSDRGTPFSSCAMTIFMVLDADDWDGSDDTDSDTGDDDDYIIGGQANNHNWVRFDSKDRWSLKMCTTSGAAEQLIINHNLNFLIADNKVIATIRVDASGSALIYKGDTAAASGATLSNTNRVFHWGTVGSAGAVGGVNTYNGKIYEIIGYEDDKEAPGTSATGADAILNMLKQKYAI